MKGIEKQVNNKIELSEKKELVRLAKIEDIPDIYNLIQNNIEKNTTDKQKNSFLTYNPSKEELREIIEEIGIVIEKEKDILKGYLMAMTLERAIKTSLFSEMLNKMKRFQYKEKNLSDYNYCILAQIATDDRFRNGMVFKRLHMYTHAWLSHFYDIGVGEINDRNDRSLAIHTRVAKMNDVGTYKSLDDEKWHVVVFDYMRFKDKGRVSADIIHKLDEFIEIK